MTEISPEQEVLAWHITATTATFQVLVLCLQRNGALERGQFPDALREYMEMSKDRHPDAVLALLHDLRHALMD